MGDQNISIANLPPGYSTISGLLYAAISTERTNWDVVVWNRVAAAFNHPHWRGRWTENEDERPNIAPIHLQRQLVNALTHCTTKYRGIFTSTPKLAALKPITNPRSSTGLLHCIWCLCYAARTSLREESQIANQRNILITDETVPSRTVYENNETSGEVVLDVQMVGRSKRSTLHQVKCTRTWFHETLKCEEIRLYFTPPDISSLYRT